MCTYYSIVVNYHKRWICWICVLDLMKKLTANNNGKKALVILSVLTHIILSVFAYQYYNISTWCSSCMNESYLFHVWFLYFVAPKVLRLAYCAFLGEVNKFILFWTKILSNFFKLVDVLQKMIWLLMW